MKINKNFKDEFALWEKENYGEQTSHSSSDPDHRLADLNFSHSKTPNSTNLNFDYSMFGDLLQDKIRLSKPSKDNRRNLVIGCFVLALITVAIIPWSMMPFILVVTIFQVVAFGYVILQATSSLSSKGEKIPNAKQDFARKNELNYKYKNEYDFLDIDLRSFFDRRVDALSNRNYFHYDIFSGEDFEFGMIHFQTNGKNPIHYHTFYFEKTLPFYVQDLVIDSKSADRINIPEITNDNLVVLEGDFNKYFAIETDKDCKLQAMSFLAPDLMNALIDNFSRCDIEFFANKVRFYYPSTSFYDKQVYDQFAFFRHNLTEIQSFLKQFEKKFSLLEKRLDQELIDEENVDDKNGIIAKLFPSYQNGNSAKVTRFFILWTSIMIVNLIILAARSPHIIIVLPPFLSRL